MHIWKSFFLPTLPLQAAKPPQEKAKAQGDLPRSEAGQFSHRKAEVLELINEDKSINENANVRGISIKRVEKRWQKTMEKLDIHNAFSVPRNTNSAGTFGSNVQGTIV